MHGFWTQLASLRELVGDGAALELAHAGSRILPGIRAFVEQRGEDVWLTERGYLKVSAAPFQDGPLERAEAAARALGVLGDRVVPLAADDVAARVRSPRFRPPL